MPNPHTPISTAAPNNAQVTPNRGRVACRLGQAGRSPLQGLPGNRSQRMQWAAWQGLRRAAGLPGTRRPALTSPTGPGTQPIDVQSWAPAPHGAQPHTAAAGPSWPPPPAPGRQQAGNWIPVLSGFQPCREGGIFSFPSWKPTGSCPTVAQQCRLQAQATSPKPQHQVPRRGAVHPERLA